MVRSVKVVFSPFSISLSGMLPCTSTVTAVVESAGPFSFHGPAEADTVNGLSPQRALQLRFHMRPSVSQADTPQGIQMVEVNTEVEFALHYFC